MRKIILLLCVCLAFSCKQKEETLSVDDKQEIGIRKHTENIENPTQGKAHLPRLKSQDGKLHMTWVEEEDSLALLKYAHFDGERWSTPERVASGTDWFVNWADFPTIAENKGALLSTFLQKSAQGTYDYNVMYTIKGKEQEKWSEPKVLHSDGVAAEHGFVSVLPYGDNAFFAVWLDGRNTKSGGHDNHDSHNDDGGAMTLRSALIRIDGTVTNRTELDARICDCCNTSVTMTDQGPAVIYRDRSDDILEIRDISITRLVNGFWTSPMSVGDDQWQINGCPVNGPTIDAQDSHVIAAWFTAANDTPQVLAAFSSTSGETFMPPIRIDTGNAIGRVDTVMLNDNSGLVSWLEPKGDAIVLQVVRIYENGMHSDPIVITNTSAERQSGFPQLEVIDDVVYVAWTNIESNKSSIEITKYEL